METVLVLNPALNVADLSRRYRAAGRVVVNGFLSPKSADALAQYLSGTPPWLHLLNSGDKVFEIPKASYLAMPDAERIKLQDAVNVAARDGFQYRYDSIRVSDNIGDREASNTPLDQFATLMCTAGTIALLKAITGHRDINFADAQATAYNPGDFLTGHDDNIAGKGRRAAYVLGLTPAWRTEWGGLLLFHQNEHVEGFVPGFNRLALFSVPQRHSVSLVTHSAGTPRYSITGWLRSIQE